MPGKIILSETQFLAIANAARALVPNDQPAFFQAVSDELQGKLIGTAPSARRSGSRRPSFRIRTLHMIRTNRTSSGERVLLVRRPSAALP
jgi:hypothetical protein